MQGYRNTQTNRATLFVEEAEILLHQAFAGAQHLLRLRAPQTAEHALPGTFVHLRCDPSLPMRRPMSIMRARAQEGTIDILYKVHGVGTAKLAERKIGELVSLIGPVGTPFQLSGYAPMPLLLGGGVGLPPMVYLAEHLRQSADTVSPLVMLGSEVPFPFQPVPSKIMVREIPGYVIATMPLLEDWGIACRLASLQGFAGCYHGFVTELARDWLSRLSGQRRRQVQIFACGPTPMLRAVADLARAFALPCQISLEEFMACAVGGCAGCAVEIRGESGTAMKRVCVDGPVFDAASVVFP